MHFDPRSKDFLHDFPTGVFPKTPQNYETNCFLTYVLHTPNEKAMVAQFVLGKSNVFCAQKFSNWIIVSTNPLQAFNRHHNTCKCTSSV